MSNSTWTVRRSRLPTWVGVAFLFACGANGLTAVEALPWWGAAACATIGAGTLVGAVLQPAETLCLQIGERVRVESVASGLIAEGLIDGSSVVMPGLLMLRLRGEDGRQCADLVLDAGSAPAEELRRLRVRLLTDPSLRA